MNIPLSTIAEEILAHPEWMVHHASPHARSNESITIKHLHWSLPTSMTIDNDIFEYNPQDGISNAWPHTLCNIPWNNDNPQLLTYLQEIVKDWQCIQHFLQVLYTYHQIVPAHPTGWNVCVQFPIAKYLVHIHPSYPNDYTINTPTGNDSPYFQLHYANDEVIQVPLPNRVPQHVVHAIRRLSQRHAIPHGNYKSQSPYPHANNQSLFTAPLISMHPTSQHTTIKRIRRWKDYYPDIPMPIPQD